jgi:phage shock protein PspC (stress-responsive transcriptional regulator)
MNTATAVAGKMLADVAGGVARYPNADGTLVRVVIAALALFINP